MTYNEAVDTWALRFVDPQEACFRLWLASQDFTCTRCGARFTIADAMAVDGEAEIRCTRCGESR